MLHALPYYCPRAPGLVLSTPQPVPLTLRRKRDLTNMKAGDDALLKRIEGKRGRTRGRTVGVPLAAMLVTAEAPGSASLLPTTRVSMKLPSLFGCQLWVYLTLFGGGRKSARRC